MIPIPGKSSSMRGSEASSGGAPEPEASTAASASRRASRTIAPDALPDATAQLLGAGYRLALVAGHDDGAALRVVYLFLAGDPDRRRELVVTLPADRPQVPSLAGLSLPASRFERELHDLFGIVPTGHPKPRRLVRHAHWPAGWYPMRHGAGDPPAFSDAERFPFLTVEGDGVYEVPVGPVHAGMIGPGHFRFSVVGEKILRLKARLWFTHRGMEHLFQGLSPIGDGRSVALAESIAADTSVGHALAHVLAVEDAMGMQIPAAAQRLRAMLLELERLYNHATDLGALANDVGFGLANAHVGRIREELLRLNDSVTGHRLLRGAIRVGGVAMRALPDLPRLHSLATDLAEIAAATLGKSVVQERFANTAILSAEDARELGCLGPAARASGLAVDARLDHPFADLPVQPMTGAGGDVLARFVIRRDEFTESIRLIGDIVGRATDLGYAETAPPAPTGPSSGIGIVEGWRGTIVHRVELGQGGRLTRAKVVDPSWFNWPAVPVALADTIVPDFPLVNKSFNLSYPGNDL